MGFVGCDGGSKDESSPPKNVLSDNWTTEGSVYTETTAMTPKFSFSSRQTVYCTINDEHSCFKLSLSLVEQNN